MEGAAEPGVCPVEADGADPPIKPGRELGRLKASVAADFPLRRRVSPGNLPVIRNNRWTGERPRLTVLERDQAPLFYNEFMFFRRRRPANPTFAERLEGLKQAGVAVSSLAGGGVRVSRENCAMDLREENGVVRGGGRAGVLMGDEIGALVDGGFQKFFETASGKRKPATADDLAALHEFEEDLKEGLGQESYYNDSLGTVSTYYLYDRVKDRDRGVAKRAWE